MFPAASNPGHMNSDSEVEDMLSTETGVLSDRLFPSYLKHLNTIGFVVHGLSRSCGYLSPRWLAAKARTHTSTHT